MLFSPSGEFRASYDTTTKVLTGVVAIVLAFMAIATQSVFALGLGALVLVLGYAYSPRGYSVVGRTIVVRRMIGAVVVRLDDIREARVTDSEDTRGCMRLWGSGGLFGYYGLFRTSKLGKCTWYVTNRANTVVLITGAKTALFSPDDVDGFLSVIRNAAPISAAAQPVSPSGSRFPAGIVLGVVIAIVAAALVTFAFTYAPGPPSYTLTADSLTIHDRFYPVTVKASEVDVAKMRVVDFDVDRDWRPVARTNGFANSHYRSGWFRVAGGQRVRLYRADGRRLVLLPPKGGGDPVLVEMSDPEGFLKQARRAWAAHR